MFLHQHPYPPFIPFGATKLIVGTLPPPRFTIGNLKPDDVNFCYGSADGYLWKILGKIFQINFLYENSEVAIQQRIQFLETHKIGICDMIEYAYRNKIDASDAGIEKPKLRDIITLLKQHLTINTILFMGGKTKNGPEYFFRKHIKSFKNIQLKKVSEKTPKTHQFLLDGRVITTVSLTAPSGAANRAVGSMMLYKEFKQKQKNFNTIDFRVLQYEPYFKT